MSYWYNGFNPQLREATEKYSDINYFLPLLYVWVKNLAQRLDKLTVVELGTRGGESLMALLSAVKDVNELLGKPAHVYCFDIVSIMDICRVRVEAMQAEKYLTYTQGDDMEVEFNEPIDVLFLDTSHTRDHTVAELEKW